MFHDNLITLIMKSESILAFADAVRNGTAVQYVTD